MRTVVTFQSDTFNTSEQREYFINPICFGDDAAKWLISRLREMRVATDDGPRQEDFGWYFNFRLSAGEYCCVVGYRPGESEDDPGLWITWLERRLGLLGSLIGGRNRGIDPSAIEAIHQALSGSAQIRNVRWHNKKDFDEGRDEFGSEVP